MYFLLRHLTHYSVTVECGEPLAVTNTIPSSLSSLRAVGTVLLYQCDSVGTPVGNLTSVCQSNGVWSHITGYCKGRANFKKSMVFFSFFITLFSLFTNFRISF